MHDLFALVLICSSCGNRYPADEDGLKRAKLHLEDAHNILGIEAVAKMVGVKPSTIYQYHSQGKMPKAMEQRVGNSPLWPGSIIFAWLEGALPDYPRPGHGWRKGVKRTDQ